MYGELASVQGIVDLSPQEALDQAEGFLASQGYIIEQRTFTSVTSARQATQIEEKGFGKYGDTKEGNFVIVDFSFENNSKKSISLDPSELTLIDSKNRKSKPDEDTFGYVPSGKDIIYEQVNPGVTREGEVIFTVASGATEYRLQAGDAVMFTGKSGIVNLSS